jgi:hypothetical protein
LGEKGTIVEVGATVEEGKRQVRGAEPVLV